MINGIPKAVEALGEAIKSGFSFAAKCKDKQSETELLKDRKRLQKAVDYAEEIIELMYKYLPLYQEEDSEELTGLVRKFCKYN